LPLSAKPQIRDITPCQHGGIDYAELEAEGIAPEEILDFSANLNPFGPPSEVIQEIYEQVSSLSEMVSCYPDREARQLRRSLAEKFGVSTDNIIVGNGSTELIRLTALAYIEPGDRVLTMEPTYGEYELCSRIAGASVIKQKLSVECGFQPDVRETIDLIKCYRPKAIFICNPNNPTGRYISRAQLEQVIDAAQDSLIVLDEAYVSFVDRPWSSLGLVKEANLLVLRSMTKDYALAGLRLGYGIAGRDIIATLRRVCPPWNVNALAQKIGVMALSKDEYLERCRTELGKAKEYLVAHIKDIGWSPLPSEANFFLVEVGSASRLRRELLKCKILVRDCSSFGLPQYIRIAPRTLEECKLLIEALTEIRRQYHG
jgi:histidinol-phosphate aminotransferase